jgi:hypothetical protein
MDSYYRWSICLHERVGNKYYKNIIFNINGGSMVSDKIWRYVIIWGTVHRDMFTVSAGVVSEQGKKNARKSKRWRCTAKKAGGG